MLLLQVTPEQARVNSYATVVNDYMATHFGNPEMNATRYQLARLPRDLTVISGIKAILPALVYLPNRNESPPSLAIGDPADMNGEYLHESLKSNVHSTQKTRNFRGSPVTSALLVDHSNGRSLFLDDDSDDATKYITDENKDMFKKLYEVERIEAGTEFGKAGLSMVGLVRVIGGARKKAVLKKQSENALVDRYLHETFAALARNGKSSDVYAALVRENSGLVNKKR